MKRNYDDSAYKRWRQAVRKRDGNKCAKCGSRKRLQVHHIKTWASSPSLRYAVSNGITLCFKCHKAVTGNEEASELSCRIAINFDTFLKIQMLIRERNNEDNQGH